MYQLILDPAVTSFPKANGSLTLAFRTTQALAKSRQSSATWLFSQNSTSETLNNTIANFNLLIYENSESNVATLLNYILTRGSISDSSSSCNSADPYCDARWVDISMQTATTVPTFAPPISHPLGEHASTTLYDSAHGDKTWQSFCKCSILFRQDCTQGSIPLLFSIGFAYSITHVRVFAIHCVWAAIRIYRIWPVGQPEPWFFHPGWAFNTFLVGSIIGWYIFATAPTEDSDSQPPKFDSTSQSDIVFVTYSITSFWVNNRKLASFSFYDSAQYDMPDITFQ